MRYVKFGKGLNYGDKMPRAKSTGRRLERTKDNRKKCKNCGHLKRDHFGRSYNPCTNYKELNSHGTSKEK